MRHSRSIVALAATLTACHAATTTGRRDDACVQTYEFGNYGCAHIVALIDLPPRPWPDAYRYDVRATSIGASAGATSSYSADVTQHAVPLTLTLMAEPPSGTGDTLSVWVVAKMLDDTDHAPGRPLPVFAADSVMKVVHIAPVGSTPSPDTVRLSLHRP
ncbi:MAG TPA: hypothetical protein VNB89_09125 [Gemmatimonadaceae bacterium]|jgi:hypothetical protein|nr:hypothetical protein [Gemmatimonadaceae bacterium]